MILESNNQITNGGKIMKIEITIPIPDGLYDSWQSLAKACEFEFQEYIRDMIVNFLKEKLEEMKKEFH